MIAASSPAASIHANLAVSLAADAVAAATERDVIIVVVGDAAGAAVTSAASLRGPLDLDLDPGSGLDSEDQSLRREALLQESSATATFI